MPFPPRLPRRGFATVPRTIRTVASADASLAPSAPVTDRSTAARLLLPARRQHCREIIVYFTTCTRPRFTQHSAQPRAAPPRVLLRPLYRRSDSSRPVVPGGGAGVFADDGGPASNAAPLTMGTRAGVVNVALPNHAPRGTTPVAPSSRSCQRGCPHLSLPGHAVAVGLRCGKANTETPKSRLKLDSMFPRNNGGRLTLFPFTEESAKVATSSPFSTRSTGWKPYPVDPLLPPTGAPFSKASTGSADPFLSSCTPLRVRRALSAPVEEQNLCTTRGASGDSIASGLINRTEYT